jgi:hypothetical protein
MASWTSWLRVESHPTREVHVLTPRPRKQHFAESAKIAQSRHPPTAPIRHRSPCPDQCSAWTGMGSQGRCFWPGIGPALRYGPWLIDTPRSNPVERDLVLTQAKLGETMMKLESVQDLIGKEGPGRKVQGDRWSRGGCIMPAESLNDVLAPASTPLRGRCVRHGRRRQCPSRGAIRARTCSMTPMPG